MPKTVLAAAFILLAAARPAFAEEPRVEAFGGISYLRTNIDIEGGDLYGWNTAIHGNFNSWFGLEASISGHYRSFSFDSPIGTIGANSHLYLFLFGPRFTFRRAGRFEPFFHALFGAARQSLAVNAPGGFAVDNTAAALALGAGLDMRANRHFAIRAVQADYIHTRFGRAGQDHARISTGVVFRFGGED